MTPAQCRAARGLLDWTQDRLCEAAQVSGPTVRNFENGKITPHRATLAMMRRAFEDAGIEFTNGEALGVRLHKRSAK
jgi:transcriptional regulator with XRE-family HTH domain